MSTAIRPVRIMLVELGLLSGAHVRLRIVRRLGPPRVRRPVPPHVLRLGLPHVLPVVACAAAAGDWSFTIFE